jgi:hypothetical protein
VRRSDRFTRKPNAERDRQERERKQTLSELLSILRRARKERAEWYVWALGARTRVDAETDNRRDAGLFE